MHGATPGEEQRHLASVEQDLVLEFTPLLTPDLVHERWTTIVQEFDGAPIRDFVPVLARKRARLELRKAAACA